MAWVQSKTGSNGAGATTVAITLTSNITSGNTLILSSSDNNGAVNSISGVADGLGNSWSRATSDTEAAFVDGEIWYAPITHAGSCTVTITYTGSYSAAAVVVEASGLLTASPLDQTQKNHAITGTAMTSNATSSTTQANELVVGGGMSNGTGSTRLTAGSGYGDLVQVNDATSNQIAGIEDKTVSVTGAQTATMTLSASGHWVMLCATFKKASSVPLGWQRATNQPVGYNKPKIEMV